VFLLLGAVPALLLAAVALGFAETAPAQRASAHPVQIARSFAAIVAEPKFLAPYGAMLCAQVGIFAFVSNSAFTLVSGMGVAPGAFAALFALVMLGQIAGAWLSSRLVMRLGIGTMLRLGTRLACAAGIAALALAIGGAQHWSAVIGPMAAYMFACSCIIPAATAAALSPFPGAAGAASSLVGTLQFALGAAVSSALGAAFDGTAGPMALVIALGGTGALLSERFVVRRIVARHATRVAPR